MIKPKKKKKDLLEEAIQVAQLFIDYDSYGSYKAASRALKRRVSGYDDKKYQSVLNKAIKHYQDAIQFIKEHREQFGENFSIYGKQKDISGCYTGFDKEFYKSQKGFKLSTVRSTLSWVFYWHYMR